MVKIMHSILKELLSNILVLVFIFFILSFFWGFSYTMFWVQLFICFSLKKFGVEIEFGYDAPFFFQWRVITFREFLRHLEQTYKCLSEIKTLNDLIILEQDYCLGMVYVPTKAGAIILSFITLTGIFYLAWSELQSEYPAFIIPFIFLHYWFAIEELGFGLGSTIALTAFLTALLLRAIMYLILLRRKGGG